MKKIKILHLENSQSDANLIDFELGKNGLNFETLVVNSRDSFINDLKYYLPDIILAEHSIPSFNSINALEYLKQCQIDIPLILVTGTVTEKHSIEIVNMGASDFIMKDRLTRLPTAIITALKNYRNEKELKQYLSIVTANASLFKKAERIALFGIWETNFETLTTKWSDETYRLLGYKVGDVVPSKENFFKSIYKEDFAHVKKLVDEVIANGDSAKMVFRVKSKEGIIKYIESEFLVERNEKKEPIRITGFNRDVTEKKKAEEQILFAATEQKSIIDSSLNHIALLDDTGKIIEVNKAWCEFAKANNMKTENYGVGADYIKVSLNAYGTSEEAGIKVGNGIKNILSGALNEFSLDYRCDSPTEKRWFKVIVSPVQLRNASGAIVMHINTTEANIADEKIIRNEKKFRALVENTDDIISLSDATGKITYVSPALQSVTGYRPDEFTGKSFSDIEQAENKEKSKLFLKKILRNPGVVYERIIKFMHKNGTYRWVVSKVTNLLHDKNVRGIISNFRDITERKESEVKIAKANRLYAFISQINQTIVHVENQQELFDKACRIAVKTGNFKMAWIGLSEKGSGIMKNVAHCGATAELAEELKNFKYQPDGPIAKVLEGLDYCVANDVENKFKQIWYTNAKGMGFKSAISLPIKKSGNIIGAFNMYFTEKNHFDNVEIRLLKEASDDISFALDVFEKREQHRNAEEKIKESEERYRQVSENPLLAIAWVSPEGKVLYVNKSFCGMLEYTEEELIGTHFAEHTYPEDLKIQIPLMEKLVRGEMESLKIEKRYLTKGKEIVWGESNITLIRNKNGSLKYFLGVTQNINEKKAADEKIKESEERYRQVSENPLLAIGWVSPEGKILHVNKTLCAMFGYTEDELIGSNFAEHTHPDDLKIEIPILEKIARGEMDSYIMEKRYFTKDKKAVWVDLNISSIRNKDGSLKYMIGVIQNINQRKAAEELILRNEKKFKALVENAEDIISLTDATGIMTYVSPALESVTGYKPEELIGKPFSYIIHPENVESSKTFFTEIILNPGVPYERISKFRHKDGTFRWVIGKITNQLNDEDIRAIISNFRDITEEKESEVKIAKANRLYAFISQINQAIVHTENENELFEKACKIAIVFGKFKMAWIGIIDEVNGRMKMAAQCGASVKAIEMLKDYKYDPVGPLSKVLGGAKYYVVNNIEQELKLTWSNYAKEEGYKSGISLPLKCSGNVIGTFNMYYSEIDFFDETEIKLLEEVAGDISFALDVFKKKRLHEEAEEKIILNEKNYHNLFELNPVSMWVTDLVDFKFLDVNESAIKSYGYSREEFLSMTAFDIRPSEDKQSFIDSYQAQKKSISFTNIGRHLKKNGSLIFADVKSNEIIFNGTEARLVIANDITEKLKTEKQIIQSEKNLNAAQAIAHIGSWEMDYATGKVTWSEECCRIHGVSIEERNQTFESWRNAIHPEDFEYVMEIVKDGEVKGVALPFHHRIRRSDGSIRYLFSQPEFKHNKSGDIIGVYGVTHDITDRHIAEQEKEKLTNDIFQRNKNLEQFAYIISHNLRSPVANIIGFAEELIDENYSHEERNIFLMEILSSVRRLDEVIHDLNNILHLEKGQEEREEVFLSQLIYTIKTSIINLLNKENVVINTNFNDVKTIYTSKSYIYSVFQNLIVNSIKYKMPGVNPIIEINSKKHDGKIFISIKDNGEGIDLKKHGHNVFGLYKRFHPDIEGKGIGLFMAKSQIESLGGKITLLSAPKQGTEFIIELPDTKNTN